MHKALVSIIIPIYNIENCLEHCLKSVKNQTYNNIEVLLIDDGSTDGSGLIAENYAIKDSRFKVFHVSNGGVSKARNLGLEIANGEYLFFLDGDDYLPENSIEILSSNINDSIDMVIGGSYSVSDDKIDYYRVFKNNKQFSVKDNIGISTELGVVQVWGILFRKSILQNIEFDEKYFVGEDLLLLNQVYIKCNKVKLISDIVYYYYLRSDSAYHQSFNFKKYTEIYANERTALLFENYPKLQKQYWGKYLFHCLSMYMAVLSSEQYESRYLDDLIIRIRDKIKYVKYIPSIKYKIGVLTIAFFPKIFMKLYKIAKNN